MKRKATISVTVLKKMEHHLKALEDWCYHAAFLIPVDTLVSCYNALLAIHNDADVGDSTEALERGAMLAGYWRAAKELGIEEEGQQ